MPGDPGATVVTTLVCYQHTAHEAAGATGTRHSPRPLSSGRRIHAQLVRIAPRDRGAASEIAESEIVWLIEIESERQFLGWRPRHTPSRHRPREGGRSSIPRRQ